ncbi:MAG: 50S ribosomal protein L37ae [Candidatus Micrarchaeota archaeon]
MDTARFGASNRKLFNKAIKAKRTKYECPKCHKLRVTRKSNALWVCKSCDAVFAGGAYSFKSEAGEIAARIVAEYSKAA